MRRVWMVFAAVMICWGVQAQEGFDAKMRRAGLVDGHRQFTDEQLVDLWIRRCG